MELDQKIIESLIQLRSLSFEDAILLGPQKLALWRNLCDGSLPTPYTEMRTILFCRSSGFMNEYINEYYRIHWRETIEQIQVIGFNEYTGRMIFRSFPLDLKSSFEQSIDAVFGKNASEFRRKIALLRNELELSYQENIKKAQKLTPFLSI